MKIKCNMGRLDRIVRAVGGVFLIYIGFIDHTLITDRFVAGGLGIFGAVNLIFGMWGICPAYALANINTLRKKEL